MQAAELVYVVVLLAILLLEGCPAFLADKGGFKKTHDLSYERSCCSFRPTIVCNAKFCAAKWLQISPIHQTQHWMRHCRSLQQNQKNTFFHLASKTLRLAPASVSHSRVLRGNQCHRQDLHNSGCSTETRETSQENSSACILGKACMCRPAPGRCWSRGRVEISALSQSWIQCRQTLLQALRQIL